MNARKLSLLLLVAASVAAGAQGLDATERTSAVSSLADAFESRYVFKELATQGAALLRKNLQEGSYDAITDGQALAQRLSDDLHSLCKDAHLRVRYSTAKLPERADRAEPGPEEIKARNEMIRRQNMGFETVKRLEGNVGYLEVRSFMAGKDAARPAKAAMEFLADTDALIIDMRGNGGGDPEGVQLLCSYLFGEKPVHLNSLYFREGDRTIEFWTLKKLDGPRYVDKPVYVLVGPRTGSGAEEFTYNLQNLKRATIIGKPTWGGANPGGTVRLTDHFSAFIPVGRAINPYTKTNWEGTGVIPDVDVPESDALATAHRMALEKLSRGG
ncbi:MAG: S41 family peptidase [Fimbriimonadaceae bacterium]|nr:S41 family peptidase [Fimbriimonadaceae bacterium]